MALIDTCALHGNYGGTWVNRLGLSVLKNNLNKQICSPINNLCVPCAETVIVTAFIYDENKINKFEIELEIKILSSLDDKEYGLIIGLPTIKKYGLTQRLASQFNDSNQGKFAIPFKESELVVKKKELKQSVPFCKSNTSNSLSDKSANSFNEQREGSVSVGLRKRSMSPSAHTRTSTAKTQSSLTFNKSKDILSNMLEKKLLNTRNSNHRAHRYEEDEDETWMKDDVNSGEEEDLINLIVFKIQSTDKTFIIEARKFYRDIKIYFLEL